MGAGNLGELRRSGVGGLPSPLLGRSLAASGGEVLSCPLLESRSALTPYRARGSCAT